MMKLAGHSHARHELQAQSLASQDVWKCGDKVQKGRRRQGSDLVRVASGLDETGVENGEWLSRFGIR